VEKEIEQVAQLLDMRLNCAVVRVTGMCELISLQPIPDGERWIQRWIQRKRGAVLWWSPDHFDKGLQLLACPQALELHRRGGRVPFAA
jgi:hypothetical protein